MRRTPNYDDGFDTTSYTLVAEGKRYPNRLFHQIKRIYIRTLTGRLDQTAIKVRRTCVRDQVRRPAKYLNRRSRCRKLLLRRLQLLPLHLQLRQRHLLGCRRSLRTFVDGVQLGSQLLRSQERAYSWIAASQVLWEPP